MNTEISTASQAFILILAEQAITVIVPIILALLGVLLNEARKFVKRHASAEKITILEGIVRTVVQAAEKAGLNEVIAKEGAAKKAYAIDLAQSILNERGLTNISAATISAYIEAALQRGYDLPDGLYFPGGPGVVAALEGPATIHEIDTDLVEYDEEESR